MALPTVLICGTNDHATASAIRLFRAGLRVILINRTPSYDLHRHRTFTRAIFNGFRTIQGITARTMSDSIEKNLIPMDHSFSQFLQFTLRNNEIPLVLLNELKEGQKLNGDYVFNLDEDVFAQLQSHLPDNAVVLGLNKKEEVRYVISIHPAFWGQVIYPFSREEDFEISRDVKTESLGQEVKAPLEGVFLASVEIGQKVFEREEIGKINEVPILSPIKGTVTGLINSGLFVMQGQVVVEVNAEKSETDTRLLPPESFGIAGGALEAILFDWHQKMDA